MKSTESTGLLLAALLTAPGVALAQTTVELNPVTVTSDALVPTARKGQGGIGLSAQSLATRSGTGGADANAALTALPMVQDSRDADEDAGQSVDSLLDLRPKELSISGGRLDDNAILIDGIPAGSLYGTDNPLSDELDTEIGSLHLFGLYGMHAQSQFVPLGLLEAAEVSDASVSARHGGFQGGVISYQLKKPDPRRASGRLSLSVSGDSFSSYRLATPDGSNPGNVAAPSVNKHSLTLDLNQPLGADTTLRFGFSREEVGGDKQMNAQYLRREAPVATQSDFWRLGLHHQLSDSRALELNAKYTDYSQNFAANWSDGYRMDVRNQALTLDAGYLQSWERLEFAGLALRDAKLKLTGIWQDNRLENRSNSNTSFNWRGYGARYDRATGALLSLFESDAFDAWCNPEAAVTAWTSPRVQQNISCSTGGMGSKALADQRSRFSAEFEAALGKGQLRAGLGYEAITARRSAEAGTAYSSVTTRPEDAPFAGYTCAPGDPACRADQFANIRVALPGHDLRLRASRAEAWGEFEQRFGAVDLRFGLRADYNDVLKNLDLAPRLSGRWELSEAFGVSFGLNRYYSDKFLSYAIHDQIPRGVTQTRGASDAGVVEDWRPGTVNTAYRFTQGGLATPYNDEITLGFDWTEAVTGGDWQLRLLQRRGRDQFARQPGGSTVTGNQVDNSGWSKFQAVSMEYAKLITPQDFLGLDSLGIYTSATWSRAQVSNDTVFAAVDDSYYFYNGRSYSAGEFDAARGNFDIPVKASVELRGSWQDARYELGLAADIRMGYTAAADTGEQVTETNSDGYTGDHQLYEDRRMKPQVRLNLAAKARLYAEGDRSLDLDLRVSNLLNETGNARATASRPWVQGRTLWIGTTYSW